MRIISGWLGGRIIDAPRGHRTHPMSEKMRGAIFGALGDVKGLNFLDAFAGSGALGIEAVSRGADSVVSIEVDPAAHKLIQSNIQKLGVEDRIKAVRAYAGAWSTRHQSQMFDVIFIDPPYDSIPYRDIKRLPRHLSHQGTLVLSWPGKMEPLTFPDLEIVQNKNYNDSQLIFYQQSST
jgi:16S rRNA (guanine966-N2)-methyltransferase